MISTTDNSRGFTPVFFTIAFLIVLLMPVKSASASSQFTKASPIHASTPSFPSPFCCEETRDGDADEGYDVFSADMILSFFAWTPPHFSSRAVEVLTPCWESVTRARIHKPPELA